MNHQVMISFDVDDKAIAENIITSAARQVADEIIKQSFGSDSGYDYYNRTKHSISNYVKSVVEELLEEEKDKIISEAVADVVKNLHRTKQVKEMLEQSV